MPIRLINDNIMAAFELNHSMRRRTSGDNGFISLKLDMIKAYIRWNFLKEMMRRMGFSEKWCNIVRDVLETSYTHLSPHIYTALDH